MESLCLEADGSNTFEREILMEWKTARVRGMENLDVEVGHTLVEAFFCIRQGEEAGWRLGHAAAAVHGKLSSQ